MPNYFSVDANRALQEGSDFVGGFMDRAAKQRAGYRAAPQIAQGNYRGAAEAYGEEGMAPEASAMMGEQQQSDQQGEQRQRQMTADQHAEAAKKIEVLTQISQGLMHVPQGERRAALERALPVFQQAGLDPAMFAQLDEAHLTDEQLQLFGAEVEKQWQAMALGNGGLARFNNRTGETEVTREPQPSWADPAYIDAQGQIAEARAAATARHRAPPRGRAGGGGFRLPPLPPGAVMEK